MVPVAVSCDERPLAESHHGIIVRTHASGRAKVVSSEVKEKAEARIALI
jgi:hypothetical protein